MAKTQRLLSPATAWLNQFLGLHIAQNESPNSQIMTTIWLFYLQSNISPSFGTVVLQRVEKIHPVEL